MEAILFGKATDSAYSKKKKCNVPNGPILYLAQRNRCLLFSWAHCVCVDVLIERLVKERVEEEDTRMLRQEVEHRADGQDGIVVLKYQYELVSRKKMGGRLEGFADQGVARRKSVHAVARMCLAGPSH